jgi:lipopolysaccharide export system permease protein
MILWELVKVFTLSLLAITGIMLMGGVVAEATQQGLGPAQLLAILPLLIPSTLPWTLPATTLFATCLVYGRLAADNEILAMKAAGINLLRVIRPAVFLGLVVSAATFGLYYHVIPYTHHLMRGLFLSDAQEVLYTMLRRDRGINHPRLDFSVFVRQVQGRKLIDATFKRRDKGGRFDVVIRAREAEVEVDSANNQLLVHMRDGHVWHKGETYITFEKRTEAVELPPMFGGTFRPPRPREMTWAQLGERRRELVDEERALAEEAAAGSARLGTPGAPPDLAQHVANLKEKRKYVRQDVLQIDTEYQIRPALALGCLCFVLIGCPVGIWFSRSDYLSAFISCFLPVVFVYYPLMLCGTNVAKDGRLPPELSIWAADVFVGLAGVALYFRLVRR